jgi:hypothetical protein
MRTGPPASHHALEETHRPVPLALQRGVMMPGAPRGYLFLKIHTM